MHRIAPSSLRLGHRVHARFDHGSEPIVGRWYRQVRGLFLPRFETWDAGILQARPT